MLDLRHANKHIQVNKFRYETGETVLELIDKGDNFTTFDLKSGYHHIGIHPLHRKFLGFEWTDNDGKVRYFQFCVLSFGLSSACFVFTKVMRSFVKRWRGMGFRSVVYIDDGINVHPSFEEAMAASKIILQDLKEAGFVVNFGKSKLTPTQKGKWLGLIIDTETMKFFVPEAKIKKTDV